MADEDERIGITYSARMPPAISDELDLLIAAGKYSTRTAITKTALIQLATRESMKGSMIETIEEYLSSPEFEDFLMRKIKEVLKKL